MTDPATPQGGVTETELDLTLVAPSDRFLTLHVAYRLVLDERDLGQLVAQRKLRFPIRGSLPIPTMTALLRLETQINKALGADDPNVDRELEAAIHAAHNRIVEIVTEKTPDAFFETELEVNGVPANVKPVIELDTAQILVTLAWLAGDVSVADNVAKALTAGRSVALSEEEAAAAGDVEPGSGAEAEPAGPLASSALSS